MKSIVLALTNSHISLFPGVESNMSNVTCFDLIRSHKTLDATRRVRKLSNLALALIEWTRKSHRLSQ